LIGAEAATEKEITQRHAELVAVLVPVVERLSFDVRAIATRETDGSYLQLPMWHLSFLVGSRRRGRTRRSTVNQRVIPTGSARRAGKWEGKNLFG
jgi:hypothetical protein